jgi:uncharacterized protein (TIGR00369 family)
MASESEPQGEAPVWDPSTPEDPTPEDWLAWANALPICVALGIVCSQLSGGEMRASVAEAPLIANPNGSVHGGMQLAIADHCLGMVTIPSLPPGHLVVSASINSLFHRPAIPPLDVRGTVLSVGRTLAHAEIKLLDASGRLCTTVHGAMAPVSREAITDRRR